MYICGLNVLSEWVGGLVNEERDVGCGWRARVI